ncbi:uncharacterized protein LOC129869976 [Solanum dulcamara]|uniref:uncharacterized protein LOC129869976 n=1 Tax=Solanum dulcamara TaxID=45834 RepID=UPI002484F8C6|nr:uncharacterized protein LOC129869976 [Solanum dulcamara]
MPSVDEIKEAIMGLNKDSAGGSNGMTGAFYQQTWDITREDIYSMVGAFFGGAELSRIIHERLKAMLPKIISSEQAGFVQGKSIAENFLLVQEIIVEIRKRGKPPNLVIKLDMMKVYDRVEWIFMTKGDPLSPTLFILAAEVMSRSLNALMEKKDFKRFGMPRGSLKVNYLAFADDMIIMCKAEVRTMQMITDTLKRYEDTSGQKLNKEKSAINMHHFVAGGEAVIGEVARGILRKEFPFTYLGCPMFYKRKKKIYYQQILQRIGSKIQAWTCAPKHSHSLPVSHESSHECTESSSKNDGTIFLEQLCWKERKTLGKVE